MNNIFKMLAIVLVVALMACNKGKVQKPATEAGTTSTKKSNTTKLLVQIKDEEGSIVTIEHDEKGRIVKLAYYTGDKFEYSRTITYNEAFGSIWVESKPAEGEEEFADGEIIYEKRELYKIFYELGNAWSVMTINEAGYILTDSNDWFRAGERHDHKYEYQDGKLTSKTSSVFIEGELQSEVVSNFKYDDHRSPFYKDETPIWLLQQLFEGFGLKNNLISTSDNVIDVTYEYEFDSDGYPTKRTRILEHGGVVEYLVTNYYYAIN